MIIIGAGPAGLSAAITAAAGGAKTALVDENTRPGGQLFKQIHKFFRSREHYAGTPGVDIGKKLLERAQKRGVGDASGTRSGALTRPARFGGAGRPEHRLGGRQVILAPGRVKMP